MSRHPGLAFVAACSLVLACGGDPAPREVKAPTTAKGKKHAKAPQRVADDDDSDADAAREQRAREERRRQSEAEAEAEREERKERIRKREEQERQRAGGDADADASDAAADRPADGAADKVKADKASDDSGGVADADSDAGATNDDADGRASKAAAAKDARARKKRDAAAARERKKQEAAAARERKKQEAAEARERKQAAAEEAKAKKQAALDEAKAKKQAEADAQPEAKAEPKTAPEAAADEPPADDAPRLASKRGKGKKKRAKAPKGGAAEPAASDKVAEADIEVDDRSVAVADPSHDSDELDLSATSSKPAEPAVVAPPPELAIDRRSLTLDAHRLEVHGGVLAAVVPSVTATGAKSTSSSEGLAIGAAYGVGSNIEVGFDYTAGLNPGSLQGPLLFHGALRLEHTDKLEIAVSAGFLIDFIQRIDPGTMMVATRTAKGLELGVWARYHLTPQLSLFSGLPALPSSTGSLAAAPGLPPVAYQVTVGLGGQDPIGLELPVGAGYQASPKLYTFAELDLAHVGMSNSDSALVFADFIPLALGAFYAMNKLDLGAVLSDDLSRAGDYLKLDVVLRYSLK